MTHVAESVIDAIRAMLEALDDPWTPAERLIKQIAEPGDTLDRTPPNLPGIVLGFGRDRSQEGEQNTKLGVNVPITLRVVFHDAIAESESGLSAQRIGLRILGVIQDGWHADRSLGDTVVDSVYQGDGYELGLVADDSNPISSPSTRRSTLTFDTRPRTARS